VSLSRALGVPLDPPRLREWQARALAAYDGSGAPRDFLVTATPGSGKTAFALALAGRLLAARAVTRVIVVAPTDHLRTQWAHAAHRVGLPLDPTLSNAIGPVGPDFLGYVTTYAQVAGKPLLHRRRTEARKTLVILDEIHHAGDGLSWGLAVEEAFDPAVRRVSLSGTPFRTRADERIPFVRYEDAEGDLRSVADYGYGYREALADGVVRPVVFAAYTGVSRWRNSAGEVIAASLSEPLTREAEMAAWRTALDPRGKWVPHVIAAMDDRISQIRAAGMADAAGVVLASDQDDARAYAEIVRRVTGTRPALILSDDPRASSKIEKFAASDERIAVCVRMISEGVDIPRAACLAWLTAYRTPLFFAQAVGRVVRARRRAESATVFLPAVRPLLILAAELEAERSHVLRAAPPGRILTRPRRPNRTSGRWPSGRHWRRRPPSRMSCMAAGRCSAMTGTGRRPTPSRTIWGCRACSPPGRPRICSRGGTRTFGPGWPACRTMTARTFPRVPGSEPAPYAGRSTRSWRRSRPGPAGRMPPCMRRYGSRCPARLRRAQALRCWPRDVITCLGCAERRPYPVSSTRQRALRCWPAPGRKPPGRLLPGAHRRCPSGGQE